MCDFAGETLLGKETYHTSYFVDSFKCVFNVLSFACGSRRFAIGMYRNVAHRLVFIYLYVTFATIANDRVNAIAWPECGEFVLPKDDDIDLSAEEKQFRRKLPTLFDSFDGGNATGIENTLKSLKKFHVPHASERKYLAKQTLSPTLDIVS